MKPTRIHLMWLLLTLWLMPLQSLWAQSFAHKRVAISGSWDGARLIAEKFQPQEADDNFGHGQVLGALTSLDVERQYFTIEPIRVTWSGATHFSGVMAAQLGTVGVVDVTGDVIGTGRLNATAITAGPRTWSANSIRLTGSVARSAEAEDGTLTLVLFGISVQIAPGIYKPGQALTRRLDERWSENQAKVGLLGKPLIIGGKYEATLRQRKDFELANDTDDDLTRLDQELAVDLYYPFQNNMALFVEVKAEAEIDLHAEDGNEASEARLALSEAWLFVDQLFNSNAALQLGRQNISETREWWWDADLDALRLFYESDPWQLESGIAEQLARVDTQEEFIDPEDDDLMRIFARAGWDWSDDQRLEAFFLYQNDHSPTPLLGDLVGSEREDESDADLGWLGLRALGKWKSDAYGKINYWLDTALVQGDETQLEFDDNDGVIVVESRQQRDVRGWGLDVGMSWTTSWSGDPTLTLGYAYGSGDDNPDDNTDRAFRQTGLEDNNGRFQGVNRFNYYGELLRPELSNLHIFTAAIGWPLLENSSVELIFHNYQQVEATDILRGGRIDADPSGDNTDIGWELDLIFGLEEWDKLEMEAVGSVFQAGDAYGDLAGERAYNVFLQFNYSF